MRRRPAQRRRRRKASAAPARRAPRVPPPPAGTGAWWRRPAASSAPAICPSAPPAPSTWRRRWGRIFCSEDCIADFFSPEIRHLEKEYQKHLTKHDLSGKSRDELNHLRWLTLQEPDEIWRQKTLAGDSRYTLISEFTPNHKRVWCVCICLILKGEPSFLYLSFPTRNAAMVDFYRRGEKIEWSEILRQREVARAENFEMDGPESGTDRLASAWTEDETYLAHLSHEFSNESSSHDIPMEEYENYQPCLEETIENPDEVWSVNLGGDVLPIYHFIRQYPNKKPGIWFVVVAREIEDKEQIELIDAFPTRDPHRVEQYRKGVQEIGKPDTRPTARVIH